jgi:tetraprenyl-beta-curcumene synthase
VRGAAASAAFARAARVYWLCVFPQVRRELAQWRARAGAIDDPAARAAALTALVKRGNMEGAAAFATFVPAEARHAVVSATVAFQAAYNHLDVLSEQLPPGESAQARALHLALPAALCDPPPAGTPPCSPAAGAEGGYLRELVAACREAFARLPGAAQARPAALRAAERVVAFQAWQAGGPMPAAPGAAAAGAAAAGPGRPAGASGGAATAVRSRPRGEPAAPGAGAADLRPWELAGAAGSSLGVHALIAAAADPRLTAARAGALDRAYFPAIGALHTLLDHLVDGEEDRIAGQRNLLGCYAGEREAARRLAALTSGALAAARGLPPPGRHELIVCAMAGFYLSEPAARTAAARPAAAAVAAELGGLGALARAVFAARSLARRRHPQTVPAQASPRDGTADREPIVPARGLPSEQVTWPTPARTSTDSTRPPAVAWRALASWTASTRCSPRAGRTSSSTAPPSRG